MDRGPGSHARNIGICDAPLAMTRLLHEDRCQIRWAGRPSQRHDDVHAGVDEREVLQALRLQA
jgi:hypothetical protein